MGTVGLPPLSRALSADADAEAMAKEGVASRGALVQQSADAAQSHGAVAPAVDAKLLKKGKKSGSFGNLLAGLGKRRGSSNSLGEADQVVLPASAAPSPRDR